MLGAAFDETEQAGSELPILYGEIGVETSVPVRQQALYTGVELAPVTGEQEQAADYGRALDLAACQPTVAGVLLFHVRDEPRLEGWQSGVRYADGTPKASHVTVFNAVQNAPGTDRDVRCGA